MSYVLRPLTRVSRLASRVFVLALALAAAVGCFIETALSTYATTIPDGFVYRAKCVPGDGGSKHLATVDVTFRLYDAEKAAVPTWTGVFKGVPLTNDIFQIWVSEDAHDATATDERTLGRVLWGGEGSWIGISFNSARECQPRRMLVTAPQAKIAVASETLDPVATVDDLVDCANVTAGVAEIGNLVCDTLEFGDVNNFQFNVKALNANSVALSRDTGNAVLASAGDWKPATHLAPGMAITNTLGRAAFLTLKSTGSLAAPLITVPVPAGEAFVWQAAPATCTWRFTALGAE